MPAPDRLTELRRQRTLVAAHLAWLDGEIATTEQHGAPPTAAAPVASIPGAEAGPATGSADGAGALPAGEDAAADEILDQYRMTSTDVQRDVRKGCLVYVISGFLLLASLVATLYFALRH